jgi:hypothetical protein
LPSQKYSTAPDNKKRWICYLVDFLRHELGSGNVKKYIYGKEDDFNEGDLGNSIFMENREMLMLYSWAKTSTQKKVLVSSSDIKNLFNVSAYVLDKMHKSIEEQPLKTSSITKKKPLYKKAWPYVIGGLSFFVLLTTLWLNIDKIKEQFSTKKAYQSKTAKVLGNYKLDISAIDVSARDPRWGYEFFDEDEIIAKVSGRANLLDAGNTNVVVAFWRLANDYETNWHAGRRRDGGNYKLAVLEPAIASAGNWDFLVGGIECKKTYEGDVAIVLLLYPESIVQKQSYAWERDSNGWGLRKLPEGYLAASAMKTFRTIPKRK